MKHKINAIFTKSSSHYKECPPENLPEIALIGRSNVGKSSLINQLTGRKSLAKISGKPGKTRLINHFEINSSWYLVDLPGYGWAKVSKTEQSKWEGMVHEYLSKRKNLSIVFVLVDSRHDPQPSDLSMITWLGENSIPVGILFTKADKMKNMRLKQSVNKFLKVLSHQWDEIPPYFITSAQTGEGRDEVLTFVQDTCI